MIVLDTHVWLWWISEPGSLSSRARKVVEKAVSEKRLFISSISTWEVAMLVEKGRLELTMDVHDWIARSEALPFIQFVPVTNSIAVKSVYLRGEFHSDPADRIIIATALQLGSSVVTKDDKMHAYQHIKTIW